MWKSIYEIRLIRFEGLSKFSSCEVLYNDSVIDTIFPSSSEKSFSVNSNGKYQIFVKSEENRFSVSFESRLFEDDGML